MGKRGRVHFLDAQTPSEDSGKADRTNGRYRLFLSLPGRFSAAAKRQSRSLARGGWSGSEPDTRKAANSHVLPFANIRNRAARSRHRKPGPVSRSRKVCRRKHRSAPGTQQASPRCGSALDRCTGKRFIANRGSWRNCLVRICCHTPDRREVDAVRMQSSSQRRDRKSDPAHRRQQ